MNYMKKILMITNLLFLILIKNNGSNLESGFFVDYASFFHTKNQNKVEIYYRIDNKMLTFKKTNNQYTAKFEFNIQIHYADDDKILYSDSLQKRVIIDTYEKTKAPELFTLESYTLYMKSGNFIGKITITDLNNNKQYKKNIPITIITNGNGKKLFLSDIELAIQIKKAKKNQTKFVKYNEFILPHPSNTFGTIYPLMYFYYEICNYYYKKGDSLRTNYITQIEILDSNKKIVKQYEPLISITNFFVGKTGIINVSALKNGTYYLKISVKLQGKNRATATQSKKFIIQNGKIPKSLNTQLSKNTYSLPKNTLSVQDSIFTNDIITYIATPQEQSILNSLSNDTKIQFFKKFWKTRDKKNNPPIVKNSEFTKYLQRYKYANKHFSTFRNGWKTDRGKIYILYGEPDEINDYPHETGEKPYTVWIYYSHGGRKFIFIDEGGYGDYKIIYDSKNPEYYNVDKYQTIINNAR